MSPSIPADVSHLIAKSENSVSEANLALTGDKLFLPSASGSSFVMYGEKGKTRIALGAPIGLECESSELIQKFITQAMKDGFSPAFYAVRERYLESFQDSKMKSQKIGEMALVSIDGFDLAGKERARYRQARNRAQREGLEFDIIEAEADSDIMGRLSAISDDWLKEQQGKEKGFSLGRFDRDVLSRQKIAVAKKEGQIIAFSNLWTCGMEDELSLDLIRYQKDSMVGVIDYLLVEAMMWGSEQGYKTFSLGMAPLAGLDKEDHRSVMSHLCRLAFKHGDRFYGFQGIRQFKKKFNPEWEAVYLIAPKQRHMPGALKNLALLSAGGYKGLLKRDG